MTAYSLPHLIEEYENGVPLKYLYFWGHTPSQGNAVDKSCFSQWFESPFTVGTTVYKTAEHYMMAQKAALFGDTGIEKQIIESHKPGEAKALGREVRGYNEEIWDAHKFNIVVRGSIHKFNQNRALGDYLLTTGDRILVEASPIDAIWGAGLAADNPKIHNLYLWRGTNLLGFALMQARDFLRDFGYFEPLKKDFNAPWEQYPGVGANDMFWRMGQGEDFLAQWTKAYNGLTERNRAVYRLTHPQPFGWDFY